jgi:hypothetical protein
MKYESVKEFVGDLIDNEGITFADNFGRKWQYKNYAFINKDLGDIAWSLGLDNLHLYGTNIFQEI